MFDDESAMLWYDRALDAALEFASLLLETGAETANGKMLPPGGKILPDGGAEGLPVIDVAVATVDVGLADASGLAAETPTLLDPETWEVKLRSGITFHNGEPFNADAVVFSVA